MKRGREEEDVLKADDGEVPQTSASCVTYKSCVSVLRASSLPQDLCVAALVAMGRALAESAC